MYNTESKRKGRRRTRHQDVLPAEIWTEIAKFCKTKTIKKTIMSLNNPIRKAVEERYHEKLATFQGDVDETVEEVEKACKEYIFQERKMSHKERKEKEEYDENNIPFIPKKLAELELKHVCSGYIINKLLLKLTRKVLKTIDDGSSWKACVPFSKYTDTPYSRETIWKRCVISRFEIVMEHILSAENVKHRRFTKRQARFIEDNWRVYDSKMRRIILWNHRKIYTTRLWFTERLTEGFEMKNMPQMTIRDPETVKQLNQGFDHSERETVLNTAMLNNRHNNAKTETYSVRYYDDNTAVADDGSYPSYLRNYWPVDGRVTQWQARQTYPKETGWKPLNVEISMFLDAVKRIGGCAWSLDHDKTIWMTTTEEPLGFTCYNNNGDDEPHQSPKNATKPLFVVRERRGSRIPTHIQEGCPERFASSEVRGHMYELREMSGCFHLLDVHKSVSPAHKMFFHPSHVYER